MSKSDVSIHDPKTTRRDSKAKSAGYFSVNPVTSVGRRLMDELKRTAEATGENARLSLHEGPNDDGVHEMIIYQHRARIHPPKKHLNKSKSFHIIEGKMLMMIFDEEGALIDHKVIGENGDVYYRINKGVYHADFPVTDYVIHHETTEGPFLGENDCIFAPWAPARDDIDGLNAFSESVIAQTVERPSPAETTIVTGAGGYCGSAVVNCLTAASIPVVAVIRPNRSTDLTGGGNLQIVETDIKDPGGLPYRTDTIVHAAAKLGVKGVTAAELARENVEPVRKLIDYALEAETKRFIFFSAISIYGRVSDAIVSEATPIVDPPAYAVTKRLGEQMLAEVGDRLPSLSIRLPGVVGPGAKHGWLTGVLEKLRRNEPVSFVNPDTPFNNVVHVDDLAAFVRSLATRSWSGAEIVNLAAGDTMPVGEVVERLKKKIGSSSRLDARIDGNATSFTIDATRAIELFEWPAPSMADTLDRLI